MSVIPKDEVLTLKYRPQDWPEVVGQEAVVRSFKAVLAKRSNRTFLLAGPSGTGKTTLARIAARHLGIEEPYEVNAANATGIDDMRAVIATLQYKALGGGKGRAVILDECHRLSPPAFASLLKPLEEPPADVWWFLCTTDVSKVPAAIVTRCTSYTLKPVAKAILFDMLCGILKKEKLEIGKNLDDEDAIIELCAKAAQGSPRAALVNLGACLEASSVNEAEDLLQQVGEASAAVELARALMAGAKWHALSEIIAGLKAENPESVRHVVRAYMTNVILGGGKGNVEKHFAILEAFSQPFAFSDGVSPLVLACGQLLFGSRK